MKTYYRTCEFCGANLDPGESCDCLFVSAQKAPRRADNISPIFYPQRMEKAHSGKDRACKRVS